MNILFLENKLRVDKLGILYLSAVLKSAGHNVNMIEDSVTPAEEYLNENHVDFIMYSVMSGEHPWYFERNRELKREFDFVSVFGGPHFTLFADDVLKDVAIDHVVVGPAESVINQIVNAELPEKVIRGSIPTDVNAILPPDREMLYQYDEFGKSNMKRFIAGRDCPMACSYCFNHSLRKVFKDQKKSFYQRTTPRRMVDEIKEVRDKYGLKTVYFNDDDWVEDHDWVREFCRIYKEEVNLPFCGSVKAKNVTEEIVKIMADASCHFMNVAIESANRQTQILIRRGWQNNDQIAEAVRLFESHGIMVRTQNIIGLPADDPLADALETYEFNIKLSPTDSWAAILQPFYGTDIWKVCRDKGYIDESVDCKKFYEGTPLDIPNKKEIENLHKWWYFAVKYKIPVKFLKIILQQDLTEEVKKQIQDYRWELTAKEIYGLDTEDESGVTMDNADYQVTDMDGDLLNDPDSPWGSSGDGGNLKFPFPPRNNDACASSDEKE
tara:strand:- start:2669 stop:4153 length:1485 start_codon:yes stop_codon:yes gene_type:complete